MVDIHPVFALIMQSIFVRGSDCHRVQRELAPCLPAVACRARPAIGSRVQCVHICTPTRSYCIQHQALVSEIPTAIVTWCSRSPRSKPESPAPPSLCGSQSVDIDPVSINEPIYMYLLVARKMFGERIEGKPVDEWGALSPRSTFSR